MAVIRGDLEAGNFFVMRRAAIEDDRLSLKAKGLLAYLLSKPPGWKVSTSQLAGMGPDGKDAVGTAMRELVACGYSAMVEIRKMGGTVGYDYIITDVPEPDVGGNPAVPGKSANGGKPAVNGKSATSNKEVSSLTRRNTPPVVPQGGRTRTRGMTKPKMEAHEEYPRFNEIWRQLPSRGGHSDPKPAAFKAYLARLKEGAKPEEMELGAQRYAAYCDATGKTGTETVMQGQRFFGPNYEWEHGWEIPATGANR